MIDNFQYQGSSTNVVFGSGVAAQVGRHAKRLGIHRAFVVTDPAMAQTPARHAAVDALVAAGVEVTLFTDVVLDPTDFSVEQAAVRYRASGADGVIALGGGSAMDTAKALGVLVAANATQIAPFYFGGGATPVGIPPLICIPTTAGTGSEVTFVAIVTEADSQRKMLVRHPLIAPTVALVDPLLSATMPPALTAYTGMDALSHALEALTSTLAGPLSDALAYDAIPRIIKALPCAVVNGADQEARAEMSYAALVAGMAFLSGRVHLGHAIGHSLGTVYHVPHGLACIVCMPAILELLRDECAVQLERIAPAFGVETGADVPKALEDVMQRCEIPRLSTAIGLDSRVIPDLVELVQGESRLIALSRRQPTDEEWEQVFAKSM